MSDEYTELIDLGFSVADAEEPIVEYNDDDLNVSFINWQEKKIGLSCSDTIAFRWQRAEYYIDKTERFDSTHIVHNSEWLKAHEDQGETWESVTFHHYKLNFNAAGILDIICTKIKVTERDG